MKRYFVDLLSRISEAPSWFDSNGTPRYGDFSPDLVPDVYTDEVLLLLIRCQGCLREFRVAIQRERYEPKTLKSRLPHVYYGDPPNVRCCPAGPTMSSESVKVLEYWERSLWKWIRLQEYEVPLFDAQVESATPNWRKDEDC